MRRLLSEVNVMGRPMLSIFGALTVFFALLAFFSGPLLNVSGIGFEVIYPFMTAIAVGEWGKTRADSNFDVIAAQSNALFSWVAGRFAAAFLTGSLFAAASMVIVFFARHEMPLWEMAALYVPPAFLLSTICALCGICFSGEHVATLICGILWLLNMLGRSMLRVPGLQFVYLFIRYAGDHNGIWLINKISLTLIGLGLWLLLYGLCKRRWFMK